LGGFDFSVYEQEGDFQESHFVILKISRKRPPVLTKQAFFLVTLFTRAIPAIKPKKLFGTPIKTVGSSVMLASPEGFYS